MSPSSPLSSYKDAQERVEVQCGVVRAAYESACCGNFANTTFSAVDLNPYPLFVKAGSHLSHAESFSGAKVSALISATECAVSMPAHAWQADPRSPPGYFCAVGAFDGMNAMAVAGDGTFQTINSGKTYMRTFINTEITRAPSDPRTPTWYISTVEGKGGYGEPAPAEHEKLLMYGAIEQFFDFDRETLEAVNGGHAIKKVYTANKVAFNEAFDASLTADQIFGIVTDYSELHNNVQPQYTERYHPDCSSTSDSRSCGLNGHCGSKLSIAHEFSYETSSGVPAYGQSSGVGFEDDVMFIAEEGHPLADWSAGDAITGTVQVLDVRKGNLYQLPHLSVGVIEMAFTVSTGHPDYIAVGIEEYGISGEVDGVQGGSRWNLWIGKKNKDSDNFLERNGLAPNSGRLYVFVADSGEEDMATFLEWPASGKPEYNFSPKAGKFKPLARMWDGDYKTWTAAVVNTMATTDGSYPVHMTNRGKQEWGAVNPDQPNQWAIAETGLGGSTGGKARGCEDKTDDCPMGTSSSTVTFLEADFVEALASVESSSTTARNSAIKLPESITARVTGVLADQVFMGPHRAVNNEKGFAGVDSVYWLKGGNLLASEDSYGPGGFNMGILYNVASRKSVPIVGAISKYGITLGKMNAVAMAPFGSYSGSTNQEMTGFFDASAALSVSVPYTPQTVYDAYDSKHIIVNNQMKGSAGPMDQGFYYAAQTHMVILPDIDWSTYPTNPSTLDANAEAAFVTAYGKYRRKLNEKARRKLGDSPTDILDDWHAGHDDNDATHH